MFLERHLALHLRRAAHLHEPVLLQGPRASGKTALLRREFPDYLYLSCSDPADRARARRDPRAFLARLRQPAILDDIHRAPELAALFQQQPPPLPLLLASSLRLALAIPTFQLHAPTLAERQRRPPLSLDLLGRFAPSKPSVQSPLEAWPPATHPHDHDIRSLINVHDLDRFYDFLSIASQRSAQVLDLQSLARAAAISHRTAVRWLDALEGCFLTIRLQPSTLAFGRRLVRRPKLHFLSSKTFESEVFAELYVNAAHAALQPVFQYWRDSNGFEIPLLLETGSGPVPIAISQQPSPTVEAALQRWMRLANTKDGALITRSPATPGRREGRLLRYAISQL